MQVICKAIHVLILFAVLPLCIAHPAIKPLCEGCGSECSKCRYGVVTSSLCGVPECRRGPGEYCGGPSDTWGVCGDGLICNCNKCAGCSLDVLECYENRECLPRQSLESRHVDFLNRFPFNK